MTLIRSVVSAALCGLLLITPALGHEGHDHGDAPPVLTVQTAPRASASAPPFELVAVANGNMLTIYLDQFETNTPIIGATIEVETPAGAMQAQPSGEIYRLDADWIAAPGTHELLFTVADDSSIDLLTASLTIPAPAGPAAALRRADYSPVCQRWSLPRSRVCAILPGAPERLQPLLLGSRRFWLPFWLARC